MRITRATVAAVAAVGLALLAGGCRTNGAAGTGAAGTGTAGTGAAGAAASASSAPATQAPGGAAGSCVVGTWRATSLNLTISTNGATTTATGGSGYTLTVSATGATVVDFARMQPVTFATKVSGTEVKGRFSYGGTVRGQLRVPAGASGQWQPAGTVDWSTLTVTVELLSPVQVKVFDGVRIADFAAAGTGQTGGAVDAQPVLHAGTFRCSGDTLILGPPSGSPVGGTWTLRRA